MQANIPTAICLDDVIEGAINFRDLGGYSTQNGGTVRRGLVYRSGMTQHITENGLRDLAAELGIRTVVDLRSAHELELDGLARFDSVGIVHRHAPVMSGAVHSPAASAESMRQLLSGELTWATQYMGMVASGGEAFRALFETLAEGGTPLVFQCAGGRDRTGVAAALLLATAGVDDDAIEYLVPHRAHFARFRDSAGMTAEEFERLTATRGNAMEEFLAALRKAYGSTAGYLSAIGVDDQTLTKVRDNLVS